MKSLVCMATLGLVLLQSQCLYGQESQAIPTNDIATSITSDGSPPGQMGKPTDIVNTNRFIIEEHSLDKALVALSPVQWITNVDGTITSRTNQYWQLETLAKPTHLDPVIRIHERGATGQGGLSTVQFDGNLNHAEALQIELPGRKLLQGHVVALALSDNASGQRVWLGQLKDCQGELVVGHANQVIYTNAFEGIRADVLYTYGLTYFQQVIILRENPVLPEGFDPARTRLEVWSTFNQSPEPKKSLKSIGLRTDPTLINVHGSVSMDDETLDFGGMQMVAGQAFTLPDYATNRFEVRTPVAKTWIKKEPNYLIESVDYLTLRPALMDLVEVKTDSRTSQTAQADLPMPLKAKRQRQPLHQPTLQIAASAKPSLGSGVILDFTLCAHALLNVDFGAGAEKTGQAAIGHAETDYWNHYVNPNQPNGEVKQLKWSDQSESTVQMTVTNAPGQWLNQTGDAMYDSYIYPWNSESIGITFEHLPGGLYNFYLYGHGADDEQYSPFELYVGGANYSGMKKTQRGPVWKTSVLPWAVRSNYVVFAAVPVLEGQTVHIRALPNNQGYAIINGLQIAAAEPLTANGSQLLTDPDFSSANVDEEVSSASRGLGYVPMFSGGPTDNLVAYWALDETSGSTAADSSGNYHTGTLSGSPAWVAGQCQNALSFDGVNDMVTVNNAADLQITGNITIAFWLKLNAVSSIYWIRLLGKGQEGYSNREYGLWVEPGTQHRIMFQQLSGGVPKVMFYSDRDVPLNQWVHIVVTVNGSTVKLYWNGSPNTTATRTGAPTGTTEPLTLGYIGQAMYLNGMLDEVKVYNRALTDTEVMSLTATSDPDAVAYWALDESSGTTVSDSTGNGHTGMISGDPTWVVGKTQNALNFDGYGDMVTVNNAADLQIVGDLTIAFWLKQNVADNAYWIRLIGKGSAEYDNREYCVWIEPESPHRIVFQQLRAGSPLVMCYSSVGVPLGQWVHVAVVVSGNNVQLYWNGAPNTAATRSGAPLTTSEALTLGYVQYGNYLNGLLDEVKVYRRALSGGEIQSLVGTVANQAPTANAGPDQTVLISQGASLDGGATDDGLPNGTLAYTWTKDSGPANGVVTFANSNAADTTATFSITGTYILRLTVSDSQLSSSDTITISVVSSLPVEGLKASWNLNETSGTTAADASGNGHNGILSGNPTWSPGKLNNGLSFDGVDDLVTVADASELRITGDLTLACWVKVNALPGNWVRLVGKGDASYSNREYGLWIEPAPSSRILFQQLNGGTAQIMLYSSGAIPTGQWVHLAVVVSGNTVQLYWNGSPIASMSRTGPPGISSSPLTMGFVVYGTYLNGMLDEVKVYNRALSTAEVQALYNPPNQAPIVEAGVNETITFGTIVKLSGAATDDGLPSGSLTSTWSKDSGPGTVIFPNPNSAITSIIICEPGIYVLRLTANDGQLTTSDTITITVEADQDGDGLPDNIDADPDVRDTSPPTFTINTPLENAQIP